MTLKSFIKNFVHLMGIHTGGVRFDGLHWRCKVCGARVDV